MSRVTAPQGFVWIQDGRMRMLLRSDAQSWLAPLLRAALAQWAGYATRPLAGGRGGARVVPAHAVVVRPYRRGGLPAWLLRDTYLGWSPRPFRELCVTSTLQARGAPVVEVYGAAVEHLLPGCYRGWLATRYMEGARTLWDWASDLPPATERGPVWQAVGKAIRRLHACGAHHPDLNANNMLLCPTDGVLFIDFDRARLTTPGAVSTGDLDRLWRSLRKLDPEGRYVAAADFDILRTAYEEAPACA